MFDFIHILGFKTISRKDAKTQSYFETISKKHPGSAELYSAKILNIHNCFERILGTPHSNYEKNCANLRNLWIVILFWERRHLAGNILGAPYSNAGYQ